MKTGVHVKNGMHTSHGPGGPYNGWDPCLGQCCAGWDPIADELKPRCLRPWTCVAVHLLLLQKGVQTHCGLTHLGDNLYRLQVRDEDGAAGHHPLGRALVFGDHVRIENKTDEEEREDCNQRDQRVQCVAALCASAW